MSPSTIAIPSIATYWTGFERNVSPSMNAVRMSFPYRASPSDFALLDLRERWEEPFSAITASLSSIGASPHRRNQAARQINTIPLSERVNGRRTDVVGGGRSSGCL